MFHSGCVAKGRRFASAKRANSRGPSQEGVCPRIADAFEGTVWLTRRKPGARGNRASGAPSKNFY